MNALAEAREVSKRYGRTPALDRVSLAVGPGEVLALLGPNGAGKTTLVRILVGLVRPDRGQARLFGGDPRAWTSRLKLGVTPQETGFPPTLRVRELVELVRAHYPRPAPTAELLARFGLDRLASRLAERLSGGEKRRLALALAFAGNPELAVLDEPTAGLDVESRRALWRAIAAFRDGGGGVLLTTHYLEEAERLADRVAILHRGRLLAVGSVEEIRARVGLKRVAFSAERLPPLPGVVRRERAGDRYVLYTADADGLVRALVEAGVPFRELEVAPVPLEEAFLHLTGGESA